MSRTRPPFRADQVGSLLRSAALKDARSQREAGAITDAELARIEDEEIKKIIAKQEQVGLQSITDGEFRRSWWHFDFLKKLDYPIAPLVLAMVLGDKAEDAFRQSMIFSKGSMGIFWSNSLVGTITTLALVLLFWPMIAALIKKLRAKAVPA